MSTWRAMCSVQRAACSVLLLSPPIEIYDVMRSETESAATQLTPVLRYTFPRARRSVPCCAPLSPHPLSAHVSVSPADRGAGLRRSCAACSAAAPCSLDSAAARLLPEFSHSVSHEEDEKASQERICMCICGMVWLSNRTKSLIENVLTSDSV
jgi:hypothetical protein